MKKLSTLVNESKQKLDIQDDTINYIDTADLLLYKDITKKFLSEDGKNVVDWLIEHPDYVEELAAKNAKNALATFYDNGVPTTPGLKELYKWVGKIVKAGRLLEIPVFQTKEQFEAIINKEVSPDEIILDFSTEQGRNEVAKKYDSLVWKIARQFAGKSNFDLEELHALGAWGLVDAMNTYGKKTDKSEATDEQVKGYTFLSWASYKIRIFIIEHIKDQGHLVRVPRSQQSRERAEKGRNTKTYSVSVETPVGKDKDGNSKRLLDKIGDYERAGKSMEDEDNARLWENIHRILSKKFDERTLDIFYSKWGVNGYKKLSGKEIMAKYGFKNQSNINAIEGKVRHFMITDPKMKGALLELYEFNEARKHDDDMEDNMFEARKLDILNILSDED